LGLRTVAGTAYVGFVSIAATVAAIAAAVGDAITGIFQAVTNGIAATCPAVFETGDFSLVAVATAVAALGSAVDYA